MNLFVRNEYKPHDMVMVNNDVLSYYYDKENGQDYSKNLVFLKCLEFASELIEKLPMVINSQ